MNKRVLKLYQMEYFPRAIKVSCKGEYKVESEDICFDLYLFSHNLEFLILSAEFGAD